MLSGFCVQIWRKRDKIDKQEFRRIKKKKKIQGQRIIAN